MDTCPKTAAEAVIGCCDLFAVYLGYDATGQQLARTATGYPVKLNALAGRGRTES